GCKTLPGGGRTNGSRWRASAYKGGALCMAATRKASASRRNIVPNLASQMRVAFDKMASNTGFRSPGEEPMTARTRVAAESCSKASSRSRASRRNSVSWASAEERRRRTLIALRRFGIPALRRRVLVGSLPAVERRRIAHPKGLGLRRFSSRDYSRDLRPAKWGSGVGLHGNNLQPTMNIDRVSCRCRGTSLREHALSEVTALPPKADIAEC